MTVANVIDKRRRPYRWKSVYVIAEATSHDNSVADADQTESRLAAPDYVELGDLPLSEAISWAQNESGEITLFVYDAGSQTVDLPSRAK